MGLFTWMDRRLRESILDKIVVIERTLLKSLSNGVFGVFRKMKIKPEGYESKSRTVVAALVLSSQFLTVVPHVHAQDSNASNTNRAYYERQLADLSDRITVREKELVSLRDDEPDFWQNRFINQHQSARSERLAKWDQEAAASFVKAVKIQEDWLYNQNKALDARAEALKVRAKDIARLKENTGKPSSELSELERQYDWARQETSELIKEKRTVIDQLKGGHFCSECMRSKFEIEKGGENFDVHLRRVSGHAVMAPDKIAEREADYDRRIGQAIDRSNGLDNRVRAARQKHEETVAAEEQRIENLLADHRRDSAKLAQDRLDAVTKHQTELARLEDVVSELRRKFENELDAQIADDERRGAEVRKAHQLKIETAEAELSALKKQFYVVQSTLRQFDDPILRQFRAERLADEHILKEERYLAIIESAVDAVEHDPRETNSLYIEKLAEMIMDELGLNSSAELQRKIEEDYRRRIEAKFYREMSCNPDADMC